MPSLPHLRVECNALEILLVIVGMAALRVGSLSIFGGSHALGPPRALLASVADTLTAAVSLGAEVDQISDNYVRSELAD